MSITEIPLSRLPLRANVRRFELASGEWTALVYNNVPCRLGMHRNIPNRREQEISSGTENPILFCNYYFGGVLLDIRIEDLIIIGEESYKVLEVTNTESAFHHLEAKLEHLKTMRSRV